MRKIIVASALLLLISSFAIIRIDYIDELRKKVNSYNEKYKRTKLDIVFNQPKYCPGDTAFFSALYVSAIDLQPMRGRQIIDIDLYDAQGKRVIKNRALVINGLCSSQLFFPSSLQPGIYTLVAYSNWMKNFSSSLFFHQSIVIAGKNEFVESTPYLIYFFPEGGKLINGIENNLVIKSSDKDSLSHFVIKDGADRQIASGKFNQYGFAESKITPHQDEQYSLELIQDSQIYKFKLPAAENSGFALQLISSHENQLQIKVSSHEHNVASDYSIVFLNSSGLVASSHLKIDKDNPSFISVPEDLQNGITNVVLINNNFKIFAERLIYKKSVPLKIELIKSKEVFGVRDSVNVQLNVVDKNNNPVKGHFSVRVINTDLLKESKLSTARNLLLNSDLSGVDEDLNLDDEKSINLFLVSQSCDWLNWKAIMADTPVPPAFKEKEYLEIKGKLKSPDNKKIPDSTVVSLFLENQVKGYEVISHNNGAFSFQMILDPLGNDVFFYCTTYKGRDVKNLYLQLEIEDSVSSPKRISFKETTNTDRYTHFIKEKKRINRSFAFYDKEIGNNEMQNPNTILEDEFGGADLEVNLNDYVVFPTMADVIREILPAVEYRKIKDRDVMRVYTTYKKPGNFSGPLFVIDGNLTKEISTFLNLDPQFVNSIKVIKESAKLLRFGSLCANGVIIVSTKYSDVKSRMNEKYIFEFNGLNYPIKNRIDKRFVINKTIPNLQSYLYWNADLELDNQGRSSFTFYTSDDVGNYEILIEGISAEGNQFSVKNSFSTQFINK